ncbi:Ribokinase-like protein [Rhizoclosmatium globosum]|uniref:ATP-dependent (S)-NAD(P)H-hydrate dehydratase n=1 Tax=Rhizoclosmatium globosum TaxID=329046 RepID=A0A1Y2D193_9FUNG|nr:Ribokinase-like protein [Rhizoclosmatium globosum]|eukprot:ORY53063.1 Ribokinase-like protein [Rhizoclosmatium globosum]
MLRSTSVVAAARKILPPLNDQLRKGQSGRILVVGGSEEYTGAPYYAGIAALRTGADICHIICHPSASLAIKSYSPELIVHPLLDASLPFEVMQGRLLEVLKRVHVDGLFLIQQDPSVISGYSKAILTPNHLEYSRLCEKMAGYTICLMSSNRKLGVTVIVKGSDDIISNGASCSVAAFFVWAMFQKTNFNTIDVELIEAGNSCQIGLVELVCAASCLLVKRTARRAFDEKGRAMSVTGMVDCLGQVFSETFDEPESKKRN